MGKRVILYSHDTVGLGHIRRVTAIARALADHDPSSSILILSGSPMADAHALPPNVDIVKLPAVRKGRDRGYEARILALPRQEIVSLRASLIRSAVAGFRPDLFIVDKVPLGIHGELRETLEDLGDETQVVLSLRDILDEPTAVREAWDRDGSVEAIREHYDRVLVWGTPEVYDLVAEYGLPADVARKVEYCGYIASGERPATPTKNAKKLVLATVGGGVDGFALLDTFLRSLPLTKSKFASVLLMGPDLSDEDRRTLRRQVTSCERPVFAVDFSRNVDRLIDAADVVITMGGYNTLCEVIARGRRAIVVPRIHPRREQLIRAERFRDLGLVRVIHPDALEPTGLARVLDDELQNPGQPPSRLDFGGLQRALDVLNADSRSGWSHS